MKEHVKRFCKAFVALSGMVWIGAGIMIAPVWLWVLGSMVIGAVGYAWAFGDEEEA